MKWKSIEWIVVASAVGAVGCGDGSEAVRTEFADGTSASTTVSDDGMHTELEAADGSQLATLDIGPTAATWQQTSDGELRRIFVSSQLEDSNPETTELEVGDAVTFVPSLPEQAEDANQFLHQLDSLYTGAATETAYDNAFVIYSGFRDYTNWVGLNWDPRPTSPGSWQTDLRDQALQTGSFLYFWYCRSAAYHWVLNWNYVITDHYAYYNIWTQCTTGQTIYDVHW